VHIIIFGRAGPKNLQVVGRAGAMLGRAVGRDITPPEVTSLLRSTVGSGGRMGRWGTPTMALHIRLQHREQSDAMALHTRVP